MKKPEPIWARCENCGVKLTGTLAADHIDQEIFCSLICNQTYSGDVSGSVDIDDDFDGEYF